MPDFNRSVEAQEVFKTKRKPKGPIKFNIQLNEEQKRAKEQILGNVVTVLKGKAGSGKSLLAANVALDLLFSREIEKCIAEGSIEIVPVSFMRGRNFTDCLVVVDEAQNLTDNQTELLLTRICSGSKMIFCGDGAQIDLKDRKTSGFDVVCKHMKDVPGFEVVTLQKNHRHEIVEHILEVYKDIRG